MSTPTLAKPLSVSDARILLILRRVHHMPVSEIGRAAGVYDDGFGWNRASYALKHLEDLGLAKGMESYSKGDWAFGTHPMIYRRTTSSVILNGRTIDLKSATVADLT